MRLPAPALLLLICALLPLAAHSQLIPWRSDSLLTWKDFKAKKKPKQARTRTAAMTASRITHELYKDSAGNTAVKVTSYFYCDKSWTRSRRLNPYVLRHEQTHFDITELYARKIRAAFAAYASSHNMRHDDAYPLERIYFRKKKQWHRCERKYDSQTRHGVRKGVQMQWNADITRQLGELKDFVE